MNVRRSSTVPADMPTYRPVAEHARTCCRILLVNAALDCHIVMLRIAVQLPLGLSTDAM